MADHKTILYIEDDDNIRSLIAKALEEAGFKVKVVTKGGDEAMTEIKKGQHDLLLLDLGLPVGDGTIVSGPAEGFNLLGRMNEIAALKKIPVLAYSNFAEPEDIKKALALGVKDHLPKVLFTPKEVVTKVQKYLE